jgi:hypothetical protein
VFVPGSSRVFCNCHCVQSSPGAHAGFGGEGSSLSSGVKADAV